ncbi:hypothetical protein PAXRUDRAFT_822160 [Paxillus rubicundulus Ve08.2h10]|uniref:Uncharacterized protein n=1 Tax=Paxillus rubicundulus Ve08.2h10 TaxID=930991 RepID=A0A0D0DML7_9AGAM|nr:hypothetical protein PAXRUDRAFT_822160 [Paxillus rubicundulus Ve08.2h10]
MSHNGYTILRKGASDDEEQEGLLSQPDSDSCAPVTSLHRSMSPRRIAIALMVLLLVNAICLIVITRHLQLASVVLKSYLNFVDNRDLPRPDQYDGL